MGDVYIFSSLKWNECYVTSQLVLLVYKFVLESKTSTWTMFTKHKCRTVKCWINLMNIAFQVNNIWTLHLTGVLRKIQVIKHLEYLSTTMLRDSYLTWNYNFPFWLCRWFIWTRRRMKLIDFWCRPTVHPSCPSGNPPLPLNLEVLQLEKKVITFLSYLWKRYVFASSIFPRAAIKST